MTGLERDSELLGAAVETARSEALTDLVEFVKGDAMDLPFEDNSFDLVTSHTVLGILPDPTGAIKEKMRVARPGGIVSGVENVRLPGSGSNQ